MKRFIPRKTQSEYADIARVPKKKITAETVKETVNARNQEGKQ